MCWPRSAGHGGWVQTAEFDADGARVVTASFDGTARIWDAETGRALETLSGHADRVLSARFSPDGTRVVTASADKHRANLGQQDRRQSR